MTQLSERGSNAGIVIEEKPCPHALVFTDTEDRALRWLNELFKEMEVHHGASLFYGRAAKAAIDKLFDHAHMLHEHIHNLEEQVQQLTSIFNDIAEGRAFVSKRGEA